MTPVTHELTYFGPLNSENQGFVCRMGHVIWSLFLVLWAYYVVLSCAGRDLATGQSGPKEYYQMYKELKKPPTSKAAKVRQGE